MSKTRRKYDSEFKLKAARMVIDGHKSCKAVEKDLGLGQGIVYRWVREVKTDPDNCFPGNGNLKPSDADVQHLIRENDQLRRERDILKKALGIFSRAPHRSSSSLRSTPTQ